jgi:hypothetical protein
MNREWAIEGHPRSARLAVKRTAKHCLRAIEQARVVGHPWRTNRWAARIGRLEIRVAGDDSGEPAISSCVIPLIVSSQKKLRNGARLGPGSQGVLERRRERGAQFGWSWKPMRVSSRFRRTLFPCPCARANDSPPRTDHHFSEVPA